MSIISISISIWGRLRRGTFFIFISLVSSLQCIAGVKWEVENLKIEAPIGAKIVDFSFNFKNSGNLSVEFAQPSSSCGCTVAEWGKTIFAPGEAGVLNGTYNVNGRRGLNSVDITVRGEAISGNIRRPFSDKLKLSINVPEIVKISPGVVLWRKDFNAVSKVVRFQVNKEISLPLKLKGITGDKFIAVWKEIELMKDYELTITPLSTAENESSMVTVEGIDKDGKTLRFYAHLIIR